MLRIAHRFLPWNSEQRPMPITGLASRRSSKFWRALYDSFEFVEFELPLRIHKGGCQVLRVVGTRSQRRRWVLCGKNWEVFSICTETEALDLKFHKNNVLNKNGKFKSEKFKSGK